MAIEWYYAKDGQQFGPVPEQQIRHLAATGKLRPADLVWHDGLSDWVAAAAIPGLAPVDQPPGGGESSSAQQSSGQLSRSDSAAADLGAAGTMDIHPLLALLLAICTCGLFTLWYAWRVSVNYARVMGGRPVDSRGRVLGRVRHPIWVLSLSYLTLGFYFVYWVYAAMKECARFNGVSAATPRAELTLMFVFPPYAIYAFVFKLPEMIHQARGEVGLSDIPAAAHAYVFLNPLMFPGAPFLAMLLQENLNEVWQAAP